MTKPLAGRSFAGFMHDLGEIQVKGLALGQGTPQQPDHSMALRTLFVGSMMVRAAEAQGVEEPESAFGNLWLCGLVLVVIGAIYVGRVVLSSVHCCLRRLQAVSGGPLEPQGPYEADKLVHPVETEEGTGARAFDSAS